LPESRERFQNCRDFRNASASKAAGDSGGRDRRGRLHQVVAYGADPFGQRGRPRQTPGAGRFQLSLLYLHAQAGLGGATLLEFRTQPADQAGTLLGGAGGVDLD